MTSGSPMLFISPFSGAPNTFNMLSMDPSNWVNQVISLILTVACMYLTLVSSSVSYPRQQSEYMVVRTFIYCFIAVESDSLVRLGTWIRNFRRFKQFFLVLRFVFVDFD